MLLLLLLFKGWLQHRPSCTSSPVRHPRIDRCTDTLHIPIFQSVVCYRSPRVLLLTSLISLLPAWLTEAYQDIGLVHIAASPPYTTLRKRQTVRISCLAEGTFSQPYISFWVGYLYNIHICIHNLNIMRLDLYVCL